jgi:hypothetical protein
VKTVLTDYPNGSWVDWLKDSVAARYAVAAGTAMHGQSQLRASGLSEAYAGHLELIGVVILAIGLIASIQLLLLLLQRCNSGAFSLTSSLSKCG